MKITRGEGKEGAGEREGVARTRKPHLKLEVFKLKPQGCQLFCTGVWISDLLLQFLSKLVSSNPVRLLPFEFLTEPSSSTMPDSDDTTEQELHACRARYRCVQQHGFQNLRPGKPTEADLIMLYINYTAGVSNTALEMRVTFPDWQQQLPWPPEEQSRLSAFLASQHHGLLWEPAHFKSSRYSFKQVCVSSCSDCSQIYIV